MSWRATTESGTVYKYDGHSVTIAPIQGSEHSIRPWSMMSAPQSGDLMPPWAYGGLDIPDPWRPVQEPAVGEHFYIMGKDEWRVSSPIASVEHS